MFLLRNILSLWESYITTFFYKWAVKFIYSKGIFTNFITLFSGFSDTKIFRIQILRIHELWFFFIFSCILRKFVSFWFMNFKIMIIIIYIIFIIFKINHYISSILFFWWKIWHLYYRFFFFLLLVWHLRFKFYVIWTFIFRIYDYIILIIIIFVIYLIFICLLKYILKFIETWHEKFRAFFFFSFLNNLLLL